MRPLLSYFEGTDFRKRILRPVAEAGTNVSDSRDHRVVVPAGGRLSKALVTRYDLRGMHRARENLHIEQQWQDGIGAIQRVLPGASKQMK